MIHPENCTKEELVYFITHSMFYDKLKFDSSIKDYRDSKNTELAHNAFEIADKCMKECAELEKKYSGCNISDIPVHELKKMKRKSPEILCKIRRTVEKNTWKLKKIKRKIILIGYTYMRINI